MKMKNTRFKEFTAAMVARGCGWSEKQVHALVDANLAVGRGGRAAPLNSSSHVPLASPSTVCPL